MERGVALPLNNFFDLVPIENGKKQNREMHAYPVRLLKLLWVLHLLDSGLVNGALKILMASSCVGHGFFRP